MFTRSIFIVVFLLSSLSYGYGQIEVRSNPISFIALLNPNINVDYPLSRDISVELSGGRDQGVSLDFSSRGETFLKEDAYQIRLLGKYYFNPLRGTDGWFSSLILSHQRARGKDLNIFTNSGETFIQNSYNLGIGLGYKWIAYSGFTLEISTGFLKSISANRRDLDSSNILEEPNLNRFFINVSAGYVFCRKTKTAKRKATLN